MNHQFVTNHLCIICVFYKNNCHWWWNLKKKYHDCKDSRKVSLNKFTDETSLRNIIYNEIKKINIRIEGTGEKYHCLNCHWRWNLKKKYHDCRDMYMKKSLMHRHKSKRNITDETSLRNIIYDEIKKRRKVSRSQFFLWIVTL